MMKGLVKSHYLTPEDNEYGNFSRYSRPEVTLEGSGCLKGHLHVDRLPWDE